MSEYRQSVGIMIWDHCKQKVLTVTNRRWGGFTCPGGKVDPGETHEQAARRELYEETGLKALNLSKIGSFTHNSVPKDNDPRQWECTYFSADIGDQTPRQMEEKTEIGWHTLQDLRDKSLIPDFYNKMLDEMGM